MSNILRDIPGIQDWKRHGGKEIDEKADDNEMDEEEKKAFGD